MSQISVILWILILVCPIPLALGIFFLLRWLKKRNPILEKRISLSLWTGVLGLVPGMVLNKAEKPAYSWGDFINMGHSAVRGWPFYWAGADGFGVFAVPAAILGDILVVAGLAFVGFSLMSLVDTVLNAKSK